MSNATNFLQAAGRTPMWENLKWCSICQVEIAHRKTLYLDGTYFTCPTCGRTTKETTEKG